MLLPDDEPHALGLDSLAMQTALRHLEHLARPVCSLNILLGDDDGAFDDHSARREMMAVLAVCRPRLEPLLPDLREIVGR